MYNTEKVRFALEFQVGESGGKEEYQAVKMKKRKGHMKGEQAEEFLELNLREMLLDIEERIFVGGLGSLKVCYTTVSFISTNGLSSKIVVQWYIGQI